MDVNNGEILSLVSLPDFDPNKRETISDINLINIFGGILRCDILAKGLVEAIKEIKLHVPLVVRLAGTNFEEGRKILNESSLKILSATDLDDAAKKIVEVVE